jgi:hypothetical protein
MRYIHTTILFYFVANYIRIKLLLLVDFVFCALFIDTHTKRGKKNDKKSRRSGNNEYYFVWSFDVKHFVF